MHKISRNYKYIIAKESVCVMSDNVNKLINSPQFKKIIPFLKRAVDDSEFMGISPDEYNVDEEYDLNRLNSNIYDKNLLTNFPKVENKILDDAKAFVEIYWPYINRNPNLQDFVPMCRDFIDSYHEIASNKYLPDEMRSNVQVAEQNNTIDLLKKFYWALRGVLDDIPTENEFKVRAKHLCADILNNININ